MAHAASRSRCHSGYYFITQVQTIVSRNVDPIEGAVVTLVRSMLARPTMLSQKRLFCMAPSDLTRDEPLTRSAYEIAEGLAQSFDLN